MSRVGAAHRGFVHPSRRALRYRPQRVAVTKNAAKSAYKVTCIASMSLQFWNCCATVVCAALSSCQRDELSVLENKGCEAAVAVCAVPPPPAISCSSPASSPSITPR